MIQAETATETETINGSSWSKRHDARAYASPAERSTCGAVVSRQSPGGARWPVHIFQSDLVERMCRLICFTRSRKCCSTHLTSPPPGLDDPRAIPSWCPCRGEAASEAERVTIPGAYPARQKPDRCRLGRNSSRLRTTLHASFVLLFIAPILAPTRWEASQR